MQQYSWLLTVDYALAPTSGIESRQCKETKDAGID